jgi:hypothetical protein
MTAPVNRSIFFDNQDTLMQKIAISSLLLAVLTFNTPVSAHDGEAHDEHAMHQHMAAEDHVEYLMKQMKNAYRDALRSENIAELTLAATQLNTLAEQARATAYGKTAEDQAHYKDGMAALKADLDALNEAIHANDLVKAHDVLNTQIKATRNQSHQNLDVN